MQSLIRTQNLPITLGEAWEFFSDPSNLNKMTPGDMNFRITSDLGNGRMYAGMIITYKVSPVLSIPLTWVTEITQVKDQEFFIDSQVHGPYRFWHHQHLFREVPGGVEMTDIVSYALPFDPLSRPINSLLVEKKVKEIFKFREKKLEVLFPPVIATPTLVGRSNP